MTKEEVTCFDNIREENTEELMEIINENYQRIGIKDIVISSNSGQSALKLCRYLKDEEVNIVAISLHSGFHEGDDISWDENIKEELEENNVMFHGNTRPKWNRQGNQS